MAGWHVAGWHVHGTCTARARHVQGERRTHLLLGGPRLRQLLAQRGEGLGGVAAARERPQLLAHAAPRPRGGGR